MVCKVRFVENGVRPGSVARPAIVCLCSASLEHVHYRRCLRADSDMTGAVGNYIGSACTSSALSNKSRETSTPLPRVFRGCQRAGYRAVCCQCCNVLVQISIQTTIMARQSPYAPDNSDSVRVVRLLATYGLTFLCSPSDCITKYTATRFRDRIPSLLRI
jgi:hypothetical protein